jgi:Uma2 family endonuclease
MTADEYLALGETPERYELIDGVVVMSPSPTPSHSEIINEIVYQLKAFARGPDAPRVFADTDLRLAPNLVYRPDLAAYLAAHLPLHPTALSTPPDLAVEVLSPSNRGLDLVTKRRDYDRFGVGEYWIIDPEAGHIRALQRQAPGAPFAEMLVTGPQLASTAIPGFVLELQPILAMIDAARRTSADEQ